ncbi:MAG: WGR domain-containing protein [Chitinophagaceae bacterium]|nr:WGR domain-containing protein [Chitinophagaceae bacterium]
MRLVKQTILFFKEGNSDKTYEIDLCDTGGDQYVVNFRYGRRGTSLKEGSKTPVPVSLAEAEKIFDAVETEKLEKGYTTSADGVSSIPAKAAFILENIPAFSTAWQSLPQGRNKAILQRLHNAATGQKDTVQAKWKLSRVIWKSGEYKIAEAVPYIIHLFNRADAIQQYACCRALARSADKAAIPALQAIYRSHSSPLLSRLAGAGLLNLLERLEKEQHILHYIHSLPEDLKTLVNGRQPAALQRLAAERIAQIQQSYTWLEHLYLISTDTKWLRPVVKQLLLSVALRPGYFKHIRAIYKWSELLDDFEILGLLSCRMERDPELFTHYLSAVDRQSVKTYVPEVEEYIKLSTELAKANSRIAYSNKTRWYLHRRTMHRLHMLGNTENTDYVKLATALLISYNRSSDEKAFYSEFSYKWRNNRYERIETRFPASAQAVYLHQVLSGDNAKLRLASGNRWQIVNEPVATAKKKQNNPQKEGGLFKLLAGLFGKKKAVPEPVQTPPEPEAVVNETGTPFLHLWNRLPHAYVQLLMDAQMDEIHEFAINYLTKNPSYNNIVQKLDLQACVRLLSSPYKIPAEFGFAVAEKNFSEGAKDTVLVIGMLNSIHEPAREKAKRWVEAAPSSFWEDSHFIVNILFAKYEDVRTWGSNTLKDTMLFDSLQKAVTGKAIALLAGQDAPPANVIKDGTDALLALCANELENLGAPVVSDLLRHPVPEVLLFGLRVLNLQKARICVQDLPDEFIAFLLNHSYEAVRAEGIAFMHVMLPADLQKRQDLVLNSCISGYRDVRKKIVPVVEKSVRADASFGSRAATELMPYLLRKETNEGLHEDVSQLLCTELSGYLQNANKETALNLLYSNYAAAQNVGVIILEKYTRSSQLTIPQVIALGAHENLNVREWCWKFYENEIPRIKYEKEAAVRLLESKWEDTRLFAQSYFREKFEEKDWDSDTLVALADSVKPDTEAFARELITKYFQSDNGEVYLQKLSQHPREKMQLFVTNYLERYAADDVNKIKALEFYFRSVLSRVNKGRIAKNRVFGFLLEEGKKSEAAAHVVSSIISDVSATAAIEDKARCIEILLILKSIYDIETPLEILPVAEKAL